MVSNSECVLERKNWMDLLSTKCQISPLFPDQGRPDSDVRQYKAAKPVQIQEPATTPCILSVRQLRSHAQYTYCLVHLNTLSEVSIYRPSTFSSGQGK